MTTDFPVPSQDAIVDPMKPRTTLTLAALAVSTFALVAVLNMHQPAEVQPETNQEINTNTSLIVNESTTAVSNTSIVVPEQTNANLNVNQPSLTGSGEERRLVVEPLSGFFDRITKKPFGIYITPKTSPVQPEKFSGYHTGADAETTSAEATTDIPVVSIAAGTVVFTGHVNGYGGVILIRHVVNSETVTALYGHLRIASFSVKKNDTVKIGQQLALLGTGYSGETDGERKHLHFGIIKGANINYKGYVTSQGGLSAWEDPVTWLKAHG